MDFRIISLPPFRAAISGVDTNFDFSPEGVLGRFDAWFSQITPPPRDSFMPRDFLYFDGEKGGMVWMWALCGDMDDGGFETVDFEGGLYLVYDYSDGDDAENARLFKAATEYIEKTEGITADTRPGHYAMGHIITPAPVIKKLGMSLMETFIPIRLTD